MEIEPIPSQEAHEAARMICLTLTASRPSQADIAQLCDAAFAPLREELADLKKRVAELEGILDDLDGH